MATDTGSVGHFQKIRWRVNSDGVSNSDVPIWFTETDREDVLGVRMVMRNAGRVVGSSAEREDSGGPGLGRGGKGEGAEKDPQERQKEQQPGDRPSGGVWAQGGPASLGWRFCCRGPWSFFFYGSRAAGTELSTHWDPNKYLLK